MAVSLPFNNIFDLLDPTAPSDEPWAGYNKDEVFFPEFPIAADRWDKIYDYRLLVVDARTNTVITRKGTGTPKGMSNTDFNFHNIGTGESALVQGALERWEYVLPITPQMLQISPTYAVSNTPTLKGVLEEHGGIKYKTINVRMSTGVFKDRTSLDAQASTTFLHDFFADTIEQAGRALDTFNRFKSALAGQHPKSGQAVQYNLTEDNQRRTGYYKALQLEAFIDQYVIAKKDPKNRHWRLVFDMPKLNQSYVVTPVGFNLMKSVDKPTEHNISFQLQAWRRIDLNAYAIDAGDVTPALRSPNFFSRALLAISSARSLVADGMDLLTAVRGDLTKPLEALRQASLLVKDLGGFVVAVADLPGNLKKDYVDGIQDALSNLDKARTAGKLRDRESAAVSASTSIKQDREGQPFKASASQSAALNPNLAALNSQPDRYFNLLNILTVTELNLPADRTQAVDDEVNRVSNSTVDTIRGWRADVADLNDALADGLGATGETYARLYGRPQSEERPTGLSPEEAELASALLEVIQVLDSLTARTTLDSNRKDRDQSTETANSNLPVPPTSKVEGNGKMLAPVPFGLTIEQIARRYVGDPDRWQEIATLNGLRSPYIDEEGFTIPLTSNAQGRAVNVATVPNLNVGQKIQIKSSTKPAITKRILEIRRAGESGYILMLDGQANLDGYKASEGAFIFAHLPGTISSQDIIYVPTDERPAPSDGVVLPLLYRAQPLVEISKIDLLLGPTNDVALTAGGDFRLAAGMANLQQAFKLKLDTVRDTLLRYPSFGSGLEVGMSDADPMSYPTQVVRALEDMIKDDPRFPGFKRANVTLSNGALKLDLAVRIAGSSGILPLSYVLE